MKITAITKYKHGGLYLMLQRLGWTQAELARRSGISQVSIGKMINLVARPNAKQADAIQRAFGEVGCFLDVLAEWPESFIGLKRGARISQTAEVPIERLLGTQSEITTLNLPTTEDFSLHDALNKLTPSQKKVMELHFLDDMSLPEIANSIKFRTGKSVKKRHLCLQQINAIKHKALRRLRDTVFYHKALSTINE